MTPLSLWKPTLRVRLTVMYGATFLAAGALLIGVMYLLVRDRLGGPGQVRAVVQPLPGTDRGAGLTIDGQTPVEQSGRVDRATVQQLAEEVQDYFNATLHSLLWRSVVVLGFATLLAIGLGWLMAGRALRPLAHVTDTARRVSDRGLHERIALDGPRDEIKELADTFDAMLERLDRAFDGQRRFVANASHELRTPLATQRALLEVAATDPEADDGVRRIARPLLATNERSERLIDGLLLLAQSEQALQTRQRIDLASVVEDVAAVVQAEAAARSIRISVQVDAAMVSGDPVLIEHLLMNLLQNAARHNKEGGTIHVACRRADGDAILSVSNTGPELGGDVTTLFEPFRRGRERVNGGRGAGLGLSIVRAVTHAHGGRVEAHARPGGGMVVEVRLPLAC